MLRVFTVDLTAGGTSIGYVNEGTLSVVSHSLSSLELLESTYRIGIELTPFWSYVYREDKTVL